MYLWTCNIYSNINFAWWKFIKDEFKIDTPIGVELDSANDLYVKSGVYAAIFSELICIVSKYPKVIHRDDNEELHNVKGAAVEWGALCQETIFDNYYIHGRSVPKTVFEKCLSRKITKENFITETNEDIKGAIYEIMEGFGEGTMLEFLGAYEVDRQTFIHNGGAQEEMILYKTRESFAEETDLNGKPNVPLAWLKMSCPSTGQNYLIPSDSSFSNCTDAAKYHRPSEVPTTLEYAWDQRN